MTTTLFNRRQPPPIEAWQFDPDAERPDWVEIETDTDGSQSGISPHYPLPYHWLVIREGHVGRGFHRIQPGFWIWREGDHIGYRDPEAFVDEFTEAKT